MAGRFIRFIGAKPFILIYMFALVTAGALLLRFVPVTGIVGDLVALSGGDAMSGVVSFAQWITAPDMLVYALLFIPVASLPFALLCALLFAGALGSFADGAGIAGGFPAGFGMGFWNGYQRRFVRVLILFYITFIVLLSLVFVWVVAAIPLAIISEMTGRGILSATALNVTVGVTAFVVYVGLMFARVYPMAFAPALYSGSARPVGSALGFASANFFRVARFILLADAVQLGFSFLSNRLQQNIGVMFANCGVVSLFLLFLFYVTFEYYAADGHGYEEIDAADGAPREYADVDAEDGGVDGAVSDVADGDMYRDTDFGGAYGVLPDQRHARKALPGRISGGGRKALPARISGGRRKALPGAGGFSDVGGFEVVRKD